MWPGITSDTLGDFAFVNIDKELYCEVAIFKTAYWFTDRFYLFLDSTEDGRVTVEFRAKTSSSPTQLQEACAEFCNSLIDFRVREEVRKQTGPIREALVTKAFMEGIPKPGLTGAQSNEQHLTDSA